MTAPSIRMRDVTIRFPFSYDRVRTMRDRTANALRRLLSPRRTHRKKREFEALRRVSLDMGKGDVVGVIGPNGSGKTTLLRVVAGIYHPDEGHVATEGKISSLLSLGTGFNNNLTGRDNIRIGGYLMGLSEKAVDERLPEIIAFAELKDFIDVPLKFYSSGMIGRLGFSIVMAMNPDILLIDEVFAVGDLAFRRKSEKIIDNLLQKTHCQLIVTHNLPFVRNHCTRALYIAGGSVIDDGDPQAVAARYEADVRKRSDAAEGGAAATIGADVGPIGDGQDDRRRA